ncbi:hypothetical protein VRK_30900 [Vibrio sp. MEBiC08052]|nr:hypothetical protein VRK_30900 [Vibrio sp. MEBiC08052]
MCTGNTHPFLPLRPEFPVHPRVYGEHSKYRLLINKKKFHH